METKDNRIFKSWKVQNRQLTNIIRNNENEVWKNKNTLINLSVLCKSKFSSNLQLGRRVLGKYTQNHITWFSKAIIGIYSNNWGSQEETRQPECELSGRKEVFNILPSCLEVKMKRCHNNVSIRDKGLSYISLFKT